MSKTSITYKIDVMEAFADGKKIERRISPDGAWIEDPEPTWDWGKFDYRELEGPSIRPFTGSYEFKLCLEGRTLLLDYEGNGEIRPGLYTIVSITNFGVGIVAEKRNNGVKHINIPYGELVKYKLADGTMCGVML